MIQTNNDKVLDTVRNQVHPDCIACGFTNINGLHLKFAADKKGGVSASFVCNENFEGYPGILHGGVISMILDSAMGNCMFSHGRATVTVEMNTKFRHPVVTGRKAIVTAHIVRVSHPLYILEARITQDAEIKAASTGKFYDQPNLMSCLEHYHEI
ncbi:MAG: PaaI family thioesterase [Sedimentisphaerales bacterium]|nr:PaaI family thioesterase [Sedimentisphaerales bacterium]